MNRLMVFEGFALGVVLALGSLMALVTTVGVR